MTSGAAKAGSGQHQGGDGQQHLPPPFMQPLPPTQPQHLMQPTAASGEMVPGAVMKIPLLLGRGLVEMHQPMMGHMETRGQDEVEMEYREGGRAPGRKMTEQDVTDRKARKNTQSRARAAKLRTRIEEILLKKGEEKTEEELKLLETYEDRRNRKNIRSRERALEKKSEMETILTKPEKKRSREEQTALEIAMKAKSRKNQGDRFRRERIKLMGSESEQPLGTRGRPRNNLSPSSASMGQLGPYSASQRLAGVPRSPLPTSLTQHPTGPLGMYGSPGMMAQIAFPSPPAGRLAPGMPHYPVQQMPPRGLHSAIPGRDHLHLPQRSTAVQQQRHRDGSLTISIGGGPTVSTPDAGPAPLSHSETFSEGQPSMGASEGEALASPELAGTAAAAADSSNLADVSQLLFYSENNSDQEEFGGSSAPSESRSEDQGESGGGQKSRRDNV